jgi:thiol:disulfide interchange protein DsbC
MHCFKTLLATLMVATSLGAAAQEASIRKNLPGRVSGPMVIDDVSKTPIDGLYEVRFNGTEIVYSDADGTFIVDGSLIDLKSKVNLTEQRIEKLTAIDFRSLPLQDAFTIVRGNGKRKLAVFEDPNCSFCKKFERELAKIDNVTVHVFLYPILSADSGEKSRNIWCAKDKAKSFLDWMIKDVPPVPTTCDASALTRNAELGRKARITGTPTLIFTNGARVPGAMDAGRLEKMLSDAKS